MQLHKKGKIDKVLLSIIQSYTDLQPAAIQSDQSSLCYLPKPQRRSLEQTIDNSLLAAIDNYREIRDRGCVPFNYSDYWDIYGYPDYYSDYSDYCAIYTHPDHYIEALADYLVHHNKCNSELPDHNSISKEHAIIRIKQHLSPSSYAQWVAICWDYYTKGLISCMQLYGMVVCDNYMRERWQTGVTHPYVVKYYKDLTLQHVIGEIQRDPRLPAAIRIELIHLTSGFSKWHNRTNSEIIALAGDRPFFFHEDLHGIYIPVSR
ncbi:MAG: hypothetical protein NMK33_02575 [Candidatus Cardinium sp.]|uniref:hypothetical protein n=1 Tax=Cardinium endosymbiont of Dermatophagoides farinae TaxID=2597823 RepID=UPI00118EC597|nr:hypothetical protein [Cardinium endosymbiont of Dermatophagoides farinae]TSJ81359.1 hypothetical protein FPG78_05240 [Cardinium endosymbiont of Dermatophagoides farinae]UWW97425.1 MAG: hypothetical protein NMK33_02575 [Candidatus Cardinium sp.]